MIVMLTSNQGILYYHCDVKDVGFANALMEKWRRNGGFATVMQSVKVLK